MPNMVRLDAMRNRAKQRANREGDDDTVGFITKTEWNGLINVGWQQLYDFLLLKFQDQYAKVSAQFNISSAADTYTWATIGVPDLYKALGVDMLVGGQFWQPMKRFSFAERGQGNPLSPLVSGIPGLMDLRYQLRGDAVVFMQPVPSIATRLWYAPTATCLVHGAGSPSAVPLTNDDDTIDDVNGYSEYIVLSAAVAAFTKEGSDIQAVLAERARVEQHIISAGSSRDAGAAEKVADVSDYGIGWGY